MKNREIKFQKYKEHRDLEDSLTFSNDVSSVFSCFHIKKRSHPSAVQLILDSDELSPLGEGATRSKPVEEDELWSPLTK